MVQNGADGRGLCNSLTRKRQRVASWGAARRPDHTIGLKTRPAEISPQLTAFFTSATILASSVAVNSFSAKATGHRAPSSRFALSLKPKVAYLVLNFCALWKKQRTLPSLAYAGIPYQVLGERAGALVLMMAWSRLAMARSGSRISAIFASTSLSPSALREATFCSWTRSFIASFSSSVNPSYLFLVAVLLLADFCVAFVAGFLFAMVSAVMRSPSGRPSPAGGSGWRCRRGRGRPCRCRRSGRWAPG